MGDNLKDPWLKGYKTCELWYCEKCIAHFDGHSISYHNDPTAQYAHACPNCGDKLELVLHFQSKI